MFLTNSVLLILFLVGRQVSSTDLDVSFKNFQLKHQKTYKTDAEIELRQGIYNSNVLKIQVHNQRYEQGLETYKMGINQFTDLTEAEFAAWLNGSLMVWPKPVDRKIKDVRLNGEAPDSIDWRDQGVVTNVKNQGTCGGCWAFSATGTLEAQLALNTGNLISLSEQELVDCDNANWGCSGGVVQYAYDYIISNGLSSSDQYSFTGSDNTCKKKKHKVVNLESYYSITAFDETELKLAVGLVGPVSVGINADLIQTYDGGIFKSISCSNVINHAVLAVGYGRDNITGQDYWIMKNSWGTSWGESGYFRMVLGEGLCGVASQACYPIGVSSSSNSISATFYLGGFALVFVFIRL